MRKILFLGLAVLTFTIICSSQILRAEEVQKLRIVENDWPPYFFKNKSHGLPGFAKEILNNCLPRLGYRTEFIFYPVKRMYKYLEKGEVDISLFSYKKSREEFLHFSKEPLFASGYRPVVRADSRIQIKTLSDFDDLKIGHLAGLKYSASFLAYIEKRQKAGTLITTTKGESCLRMLTGGIIDIFVDTQDTTCWRAKQMGVTKEIIILPYNIRTREYFITVSKKSPRIADKIQFLEQLDKCIYAMKKDGRYNKISSKYGI